MCLGRVLTRDAQPLDRGRDGDPSKWKWPYWPCPLQEFGGRVVRLTGHGWLGCL